MSFRFVPDMEVLKPNLVRLIGRPGEDFSLFSDDAGDFGLAGWDGDGGPMPDFLLPAEFAAPTGDLSSLIEVRIHMAGTGGRTNLLPTVIKSGTTAQDFRCRIINTHEDEQTQNLEVYVEYHGKAPHEHLHVHVVADADVEVG